MNTHRNLGTLDHARKDGKQDEGKQLQDLATVTGFNLKLARATRISCNKVIAPVAERHVRVFILQTQAEQLEQASELRKTAGCLDGSSQKLLSLPLPLNSVQIRRDYNKQERFFFIGFRTELQLKMRVLKLMPTFVMNIHAASPSTSYGCGPAKQFS